MESLASIRASLAELGRALDASLVELEEVAGDGARPGVPSRRWEWRRHEPARTSGDPGPECRPLEPPSELSLELASGTTVIGRLRVIAAPGRPPWEARDEAAAAAVAHALAGVLGREATRDEREHSLHQLRAPLTAILAVSDIVRRYGTRLSEEDRRQEMEKIQAQVRNMTRLLDESAPRR